jgi:hypothetical protein
LPITPYDCVNAIEKRFGMQAEKALG